MVGEVITMEISAIRIPVISLPHQPDIVRVQVEAQTSAQSMAAVATTAAQAQTVPAIARRLAHLL
jgi:4-hydroxy-3-methylbut-2-en-1-yl diphosphate synthase IspG/GcpE